jgi:Cd2+/Zn2+-exporting ATPase
MEGENDILAKVVEVEEQGHTVVSVAIDGKAAGLIALADTLREEAKSVILELKALGIEEVIMITGDNARVARLVADGLGVDRVFAAVMPQRKLEIIRELQAQGKVVAFAGDGVNDAPALAAADVGIAMGIAGTDVALETANVGLMQDEIERVPQVISLSRRTLKVIRQNIIFSMSMNFLSLILSSFGIIGPVVGALMHETSSLPVLANSARLVDARYRSALGSLQRVQVSSCNCDRVNPFGSDV